MNHPLSSSSAVKDHPLMHPTTEEASSASFDLSEQQRSPLVPVFYPALPPPPPPRSLPTPSGSSSTVQNHNVSLLAPPPHFSSASQQSKPRVPTTLDEWADAFFTQPLNLQLSLQQQQQEQQQQQNNQQQTLLLLQPTDEHFESDAKRIQALASRRAWADVVSAVQGLIKVNSTSHYAGLYANWMRKNHLHQQSSIPLNSNPPVLESQEDELESVLVLLLHGLMHMKRFSELKHQVAQWRGLIVFERSNQSVSMKERKCSWKLEIVAATALVFITSPFTSQSDSEGEEESNECAHWIDAVDVLWKIRDAIPSGDALNHIQVEKALANIFIRRKEWRLALICWERVLELLPSAVTVDTVKANDSSTNSSPSFYKSQQLSGAIHRVEVMSFQGRILLQMGALVEARKVFEKTHLLWDDFRKTVPSLESAMALQAPIIQLLVNQSLLSFASRNFDQALEFLRQAITPIRALLISCTSSSLPFSLLDDRIRFPYYLGRSDRRLSSLYSEITNNMALCAIYTCRLQEAIHVMESLIRLDPVLFLTDRVALNLCTLYELSSESSISSRKKHVLQVIAKRFNLHDIGPECFRLA